MSELTDDKLEAIYAETRAARDAAGIPDVDPAEWAFHDGETVAEWHDRLIGLYGGHLALFVPAKRRGDVVSIDLVTLRRRGRERLLARRPNRLRRHVLLLLRPPVYVGARPRTAPRPRGRRARRAARGARPAALVSPAGMGNRAGDLMM